MTSAITTAFRVHPIPPAQLDAVRHCERDVSSNPIEHIIANGSEPLRCCLRTARADERCILFGYDPPIPTSPYREIGPVFAHAEQCDGPDTSEQYPADWMGRPQVLRAYDSRGWIHPATLVHDGRDPAGSIGAVLAHPEVVQVHSRNIAYGCFMFVVTRGD